jgi:hypothetical protein
LVGLDRRAAVNDEPDLRRIADGVKLLFSPVPSDATHFDDHGGSASSFFKRSEVSSTELMNSFAGIDLETFR